MSLPNFFIQCIVCFMRWGAISPKSIPAAHCTCDRISWHGGDCKSHAIKLGVQVEPPERRQMTDIKSPVNLGGRLIGFRQS